jgi:hypothetical protein
MLIGVLAAVLGDVVSVMHFYLLVLFISNQ